jgi:dynein heavy chain
VVEQHPLSYENSMNNVLRLEANRYNALLSHLHHSLGQLEKALRGEIVMSVDLESTYESLLFRNELPGGWLALAFPTEANLRDFLRDLQKRTDFFRKWIAGSNNNKFWLKAFYLPQAFLTAVQLNFARSLKNVSSVTDFMQDLADSQWDKPALSRLGDFF